jgi:putative acyl-CoA dehydrogenase
VTLQASLLVRNGPTPVADAFCASRLDGGLRGAYGMLPPSVDAEAIVDRTLPA